MTCDALAVVASEVAVEFDGRADGLTNVADDGNADEGEPVAGGEHARTRTPKQAPSTVRRCIDLPLSDFPFGLDRRLVFSDKDA
jgi:hypothetical protein